MPAESVLSSAVLRHPRKSLRVMLDTEHELKRSYVETVAGIGAAEKHADLEYRESSRAFLMLSVDGLELQLAIAAMVEASIDLKTTTPQDLQQQAPRIKRIADGRTGLDVLQIFAKHQRDLQRLVGADETSDTRFDLEALRTVMLKIVGSVVQAVPLDVLEKIANEFEEPALGHRCHMAVAGLKALLRRHAPERNAQVDIVGRLFAEGKMTLADASTLLGVPRADVAAWFEESGHSRALSVIALSSEDRAERLKKVSARRQASGANPPLDRDLVRRDAIASQRIEDVDARQWLPLEKS